MLNRIPDRLLDLTPGQAAYKGGEIGLFWNADCQWWGLRPNENGDIAGGRDLVTWALMQAALSARAEYRDRLPDEQTDPRGWVGDHSLPVGISRLGNRLWLFGRTITSREALAAEAAERLRSALDVLRDPLDLAAHVTVDGRRVGRHGLWLDAAIYRREQGLDRDGFRAVWGQITII